MLQLIVDFVIQFMVYDRHIYGINDESLRKTIIKKSKLTAANFRANVFTEYKYVELYSVFDKTDFGIYNPEWSDVIKTTLSVDTKKLCKKCWARYICGGGCYGINYEFSNDISLTPLIYCQLKKYSIKMALKIYATSVQ